MTRPAAFAVVVVAAAIGGMAIAGPLMSAGADLGGDQADSVEFALGHPDQGVEGAPGLSGDVVYCGVARGAEPYVLDVVASNPHPEWLAFDGHGPAGWFHVQLQGIDQFPGPYEYPNPGDWTRRPELNVPYNSSLSFSLSLGGRPGRDQMVQMATQPLGDPDGYGAPLYGYASVRASRAAVDPFNGDGRTDNYCVTIGVDDRPWSEYQQGDISTTLPVPDDWVVDGDGSNGGDLRGMPG